ncbi:MAG: 30S ribosomal protein S12 methylthiotransferase RimO, partial [bacterium]
MHKLAYITLGCPKNQVDTETLADLISRYGFGHAESPGEADACLINTCCFIDDAKKESIDAILTCAAGRKQGSKLIVFGCMGQRYAEDISREIPEIDAVFGVEDFEHILSYVRSTLNGNREEGRKERRCDADDLIERLP